VIFGIGCIRGRSGYQRAVSHRTLNSGQMYGEIWSHGRGMWDGEEDEGTVDRLTRRRKTTSDEVIHDPVSCIIGNGPVSARSSISSTI
jgi:hypothetical protein